jgi:Methyladenine glycosylase
MPPAEMTATENDARVIRNKAKIRATVENAREVLAILDEYGSIRAYLASLPDAGAAAADMRRRFKFLGDTGVWRLLTSAGAAVTASPASSPPCRRPASFRARQKPAE